MYTDGRELMVGEKCRVGEKKNLVVFHTRTTMPVRDARRQVPTVFDRGTKRSSEPMMFPVSKRKTVQQVSRSSKRPLDSVFHDFVYKKTRRNSRPSVSTSLRPKRKTGPLLNTIREENQRKRIERQIQDVHAAYRKQLKNLTNALRAISVSTKRARG